MNPELLEREATVRPQDYWGDLIDYLDNGFGRVLSVHRDSDYIERSNWNSVIAYYEQCFADKKEETWCINSASHWAVGWVDELLVKIKTAEGAYTREFLYMVEIHERLGNYPILDDEKASEIEWDDNHPDHDELCYSDDPDCSCERVKA